MTDKKISQLANKASLNGTERIELLDVNEPDNALKNKYATSQQIADLSSGGGGPKFAHCRVDGNGTLQSGSLGIQSVVRNDEGQYTITFTPGYFSATPTCVASLWENDESATTIQIKNPLSTEVSIATGDSALTPDDGAFHLICAGVG